MKKLFILLMGVVFTFICGCGMSNNSNDEFGFFNISEKPTKDPKGKLLYEGKYTLTGRSMDSDRNQGGSYYFNTFYLKIYENCLIETTNSMDNPIAQDYVYSISSSDNDFRIYSNPDYNASFMVNKQNYDVCKVISMQDYRYGNNVKRDVIYEVVKGDQTQQLTQQLNQAYQYEVWRSMMD